MTDVRDSGFLSSVPDVAGRHGAFNVVTVYTTFSHCRRFVAAS